MEWPNAQRSKPIHEGQQRKPIEKSHFGRTGFVATLAGIVPPESSAYTIAEHNFSMIAVGQRQSLLSKLDPISIALITDENGLRYQPFQLPECADEQCDPEEFQPIFSVDDEGNPIALPSSVNTTKAVFCWHPVLLSVLVVLQNGTLCIYDISKKHWRPLSLQIDEQINPCDVQICPTHPNMIAVLCPSHICLWQLPLGQKIASPQILMPAGWNPAISEPCIGSLSFHPLGRYLAFVSKNQPTVAVWDLSSNAHVQHVSLRQRLKSLTDVQFSPNGRYLVVLSSVSCNYLLWDTITWECIRWSAGSSPGSSLVWHHSQDLFLLSHVSCSVIHSVSVCPVECNTDFDAYPEELHGQQCYGGNIKSLTWSPDCERLALTFTNELDSSAAICSDLIAILSTNLRNEHRLKFTPIGFIRGPPSRIPHVLNPPVRLEFRSRFDHGALLSVLWSQGQITFYPFLY